MKVFLTGGTGFLGRPLVEALLARGDACAVVSRQEAKPWGDRVTMVRGDTLKPGTWQRAVDGHDVVVNLAGIPLVEPPIRWTAARKDLLRRSRVDTTTHVAEAIRSAARRPKQLLSASAVGYYGDRGDRTIDDHATAGDDFLAQLCLQWERAAEAVGDVTGVARLRIAPVVGRGGGILAPLLTPFKLGLGGPWGPGTQWLPWIALEDWVRAALFVMDKAFDGPINITAPEPVTVATFARTLGAALHRPAVVSLPTMALKLALGEQAMVLLVSQRLVPRRLREAGFTWKHGTLQGALERSI
ncbi:MAG: TIGR01777 family oxidoreductase [Gemmatimonadales bacterium]